MAGVNFLEYARAEDIVHEVALFGICDSPDEQPAFISYDQKEHAWIAEVKNSQQKKIQFLPVDKLIPLFRPDGTESKRCDAMLLPFPTYEKDIVIFVELKDVITSSWSSARKYAIQQLQETIESFSEYHELSSYKKRQAYVANRKRPQANRAGANDIQRFRKDYGVTLKFSSNVIFS